MHKGSNLFSNRFAELLDQATAVEATKRFEQSDWGRGTYVDEATLLNWRVKVRNLLLQSCGQDSEHYKAFIEAERTSMYTTNHESLQKQLAVLRAAQEDFDGGFLVSIRGLVQAELFADELQQSDELLRSGYVVAAAVVAGVVLETTLRRMCVDRSIAAGKLDKMNADLAKAGVYNLLIQKRVTALADLRNKAAHGDHSAFRKEDVEEMIRQIERFTADYV